MMMVISLDSEYIFKHQVQIIEQGLPLIVENVKGSRRKLTGSPLNNLLSTPGSLDKYKYYILKDNVPLWRRICTTTNSHKDGKNSLGAIPNHDGERLIAELKRIGDVSLDERIEMLSLNHKSLGEVLVKSKGKITPEVARVIYPISRGATMMAGAIMSEEKRGDHKEDKRVGDLAKQSTKTILAIADAIGNNEKTMRDFSKVPDFRQSDTVAHCCRVFHMYSDLLFYYHNIMEKADTRRELIESIEGKCDRYYQFYHSFMPHKRMKKVSDVFEGSLPFLKKEEITTLSLAAAYHDLGKIVQLDYYESDKARDDSIIEQHPFEIFDMLNQTSNRRNVALTASMHHDGYGGGYGPYASLGGTFHATHPQENSDFVMTNDINPILMDEKKYIPGYFPAKFLEICDIYDALHNKRGYKTAKPIPSVLKIMGQDFFNPDRLKLSIDELEELSYGKEYWNRYYIKDLDSSLYGIKPYAKHTIAHDLSKLFPKVKPYIGQGKKMKNLPKPVKSTLIAYQVLLRLQNKVIRNPGMLDPILFDIFIDYVSLIEEIDYAHLKYSVA